MPKGVYDHWKIRGVPKSDEANQKNRESHLGKSFLKGKTIAPRPPILPPDPTMPDIRYVPLTQGHYAIVDSEDYERCLEHNWCYIITDIDVDVITSIDGVDTSLEHFLLYCSNGIYIHLNRNSLDYRKSNLGLATFQETTFNRSPQRTYGGRPCSSRFRGVHKIRGGCDWHAQIVCDGIFHNLGDFVDEIAAALAYDRKARELYGIYAYQNFPEE